MKRKTVRFILIITLMTLGLALQPQMPVEGKQTVTIDSKTSVEQLIRLLEHEDGGVRGRAVKELGGRINNQDPLKPLKLSSKYIKDFIKLLESEDVSIRKVAVISLGIIKDRNTVPFLLKALRDRDAQIRKSAAFSLGNIGNKSAINPLIEALNDNDESVQQEIAHALVTINDRSMSRKLIPALKNGKPNRKKYAAYILGAIGAKDAVSSLINIAFDSDKDVRIFATTALRKIGDRSTVPVLIKILNDKDPGVRQAAASALTFIGDKTATTSLIKKLKDNDKWVRITAARALGQIGNRKAMLSLINLLKDDDKTIHKYVLKPIVKIGDKSVIFKLVKLLNHSNDSVRQSAIIILGNIGHKKTAHFITKKLNDKSPLVRLSAINALTKIGNSSTAASLLKKLNDNDGRVLHATAYALSKIGDKPISLQLINLLKDKNKNVRQFAAHALGYKMYKKAVPLLIENLKDDDPIVRSYTALALGKIKDKKAVPHLISIANDHHPLVRQYAINALGRIADRNALVAIKTSLKDKNPDVRQTAALVLNKIGDISAVESLISVLKDKDPLVRTYAANALGKICHMNCINMLKPLLKDDDEYVRADVVTTLGKINSQAVFQILIEAINDKYSSVRVEVIRALGQQKNKKAVPHLINALNDNDEIVQEEAIITLVNSNDKSAINALISLLKDKKNRMHQATAISLAKIGDKRAEKALIEYLENNKSWNPQLILQALKNISGNSSLKHFKKVFQESCNLNRGNIAKDLIDLNAYTPIYAWYEDTQKVSAFNLLKNNLAFDEDGLKLIQKSDDPLIASSGHYLEALMHRENFNHKKQLQLAKKSLSTIDPMRFTAQAILSHWLKAHAEIKLGKNENALNSIKRAEELCEYLSYWERTNYKDFFKEETLFWKGAVLAELGKNKESMTAFKKALELLAKRKKASNYSWDKNLQKQIETLQAMVDTELGDLHIKLGRKKLKSAIDTARNYLPSNSIEMESVEKRFTSYARQLMADEEYEKAHTYIEELNLIRSQYSNRKNKIRLADPVKQQKINEFRRKQGDIESLSEKIKKLASKMKEGQEPSQELKELNRERKEKQGALKKYVYRLKRKHPDLGAILGAKPIELQALQEKIPADMAVVQYLVLPNKVTAFVIKENTIDIVETKVSKTDLAEKVEKFTDLISDKGDLSEKDKKSTALYNILIKPVEKSGLLKGVKTLGVAPNQFLHYVPFGALLADSAKDQYLVDKYSLFYINSTSILSIAVDRSEKKKGKHTGILALGNPDGTLKGADKEVDEIGKLFSNKRVFKQNSAFKQLLKEGIAESIIHFATHGVLKYRDSSKSHLVMSKSKKLEDQLSVEEIWALPLNGKRMVTLSACQTGVGELLSGDDVVSLENAFIYAGSPTVVATLWKISDEATVELMKLFYKNIAGGMGTAEAMTKAQRALRRMKVKGKEKYRDPFFWAAFTVRGMWK